MALSGWKVEPISFQSAKPFVEKWHYSHKTKGLIVQQCFGLFRPRPEFYGIPEMVGVMIYALPMISRVRKKYSTEDPSKCVELARLCCINNTPKNAESFFISKTLKWLKKNTPFEVVISYADPLYGHDGTIYKASNFEYLGLTEARKQFVIDGKSYHERVFSKPFVSEKFAKARQRYENGDSNVYFEKLEAKHIYFYRLR